MARLASKLLLALLTLAAGLGLSACGLLLLFPVTGDPARGAVKYGQSCTTCHTAVAVAPFGNLVTNDMGLVNPAMNGIVLTDLEVLDLRAFLATLAPPV